MNLDTKIVQNIHFFVEKNWLLRHIAVFCASFLIWVMFGFVVALTWWPGGLQSGLYARGVVYSILVVGIPFAIAFGISSLVQRPRPQFPRKHRPFIHLFVETKSFPSLHSTLAFSLAAFFFGIEAYWYLLLIGAVFVALGRVAVGVHYVSDVLVGAFIGFAVGLAVRIALDLFNLTILPL